MTFRNKALDLDFSLFIMLMCLVGKRAFFLGRTKVRSSRGYLKLGIRRYFEYHCFESDQSCDAALWYRSHQRVRVLELVEPGYGKTKADRADNGQPAVYKVGFNDGFVGDVFEDELYSTKKQFFRPDPPPSERPGGDCLL